MSISESHRHKTSTALAALISLYVIGTAVALSTPYWVSSTSPLAVFAATPLGMSIFAFTAVVLTSLAIYAINRNNEISELKTQITAGINNSKLKAPSIAVAYNSELRIAVVDGGDIFLLLNEQDFEYIKTNNQNKNEDGTPITDEYRVDFTLEGKNYYITARIDNNHAMLGNTRFLEINSLGIKNGKNKFDVISDCEQKLEILGLGIEKDNAKELSISFLPSSTFEAPEVEQGKKEIYY